MEEKMKTTKSLNKKVTAMATCATLMLMTFGAWMAFAAGSTLQETEAVWGSPVGIRQLESGAEKRFYKYNNSLISGFRYFVYQDGRVIEDGIDTAAPVAAKVEKSGLPISEVSRYYYEKHPMTVQDVEQVWGKPQAVRTLENGSEERYYRYLNSADIGMRCFQVKDGRVVANGISRGTGLPEKKGELKGVPMSNVKEVGVETIVEIESVWGKPVGVKKLAGGMEERYYKYNNSENIANRMFLFKDGKAVATTNANYF
jgi:hypothetical protein